jgi:glycosyltransferase involved in cell wall biosynthesis
MTSIGIDLLRYRPGCHGGGETHLLAYLDALERRGERAVLFCGPHNADRLSRAYPGFTVAAGPDVLAPETREARRGEAVALFDREACDVVYFPLSTVWPEGIRARVVLTLFDVQHWDFPGNFAPSDFAFRDRIYRSSIRRADVLHVPSAYTKERIARHVPEAASKTFVCPLFVPSLSPPRPTAEDGPYFHYPAIAWPHKNHALLFEAFARARDRLPAGFGIALTGNPNVGSVDLRSLAESRGISEAVRLEGYRSREEALGILSGAAALVFPSSYEGFGFPLVEAMDLGVPILASDNTSIAEVAREAAVLLPPDAGAWSGAMVRIVQDAELRRRLLAAARDRRGAFTEETFFSRFQRRIAG